MAGSRLYKIGTIYSRTAGLLKSGAMSAGDKPIWFDVYKAFPPALEPTVDRTRPSAPIKRILYPEDVERAEKQTKKESQN